MKRLLVKFQSDYIKARANLDILKEEEKEIDRKYINEHHITNEDGRVPTRVFMIDDEVICEKAIKETGAIVVESGLWENIMESEKILQQKEEDLLEYGIGIMPKTNERKVLKEAVKKNYQCRQKVIDLILRLDVAS